MLNVSVYQTNWRMSTNVQKYRYLWNMILCHIITYVLCSEYSGLILLYNNHQSPFHQYYENVHKTQTVDWQSCSILHHNCVIQQLKSWQSFTMHKLEMVLQGMDPVMSSFEDANAIEINNCTTFLFVGYWYLMIVSQRPRCHHQCCNFNVRFQSKSLKTSKIIFKSKTWRMRK